MAQARVRLPLRGSIVAAALIAICLPAIGRAQGTTAPAADQSDGDRYGPFSLLDRRSIYGKYWFPEPLRTDESDVDNEIRVDYFHAEKRNRQSDELEFEVEKSFGLLTLEVAGGYESEREREFDQDGGAFVGNSDEGVTNIEFGARFPFFQYVSDDQTFDTTFVLGIEVALPSGSDVSRDTELVPKLFNLTRIGERVAIQTGLGDSILVGPEEGGLNTLEYSLVLGYELTNEQLPLPGVLTVWPMFELEGECPLNQEDSGHNELFGTAGLRINFDTIDGLPLQPRVGVGYTFPIDSGAREEFDWGIVTSLILEY